MGFLVGATLTNVFADEKIKLVNMEYEIGGGMLEAEGATEKCMKLERDGWVVVLSNGKADEERSNKENGDLYN